MTAKANYRFFSHLDRMVNKVEGIFPKCFFRAAMASNLCAHFWPELSRVQAEIVVDAWIKNCDAAATTEEQAQ